MIKRPTLGWQDKVATQEAAVAAGTLAPDKAYAIHLWPTALTARRGLDRSQLTDTWRDW
jgi:hypothetical protein